MKWIAKRNGPLKSSGEDEYENLSNMKVGDS